MSNSKEITRQDIDKYLFELAKEYKKANKHMPEAEIIIAGGAAMMLNYNFRDATTDIDAIVKASSTFKDIAHGIGDKYNLANDWINSDFIHTSSYSSKLIEHSKFYKTFCGCLTIRTVKDEYLIAMKLKSGRPYKKDMSDVIGVLKENQEKGTPLTFDDIDKAVSELYGSWKEIRQESKDLLMYVLEADDYEELYYSTLDAEIENKKILLNVEHNNPNLLTEQNVENYTRNISAEVKKKISHNDFDIDER